MSEEAKLVETGSGLAPVSPGWFVVNVGDAAWSTHPTFGATCVFEGEGQPFAQFGVNIRVLRPGQPNGLYHAESNEEDFLVLSGECLLLVEGEERPLAAWDFVHCAPGTAHIFVGAGTQPCVVLMAGTRDPGRTIEYPVARIALDRGAGVATATGDPRQAYAGYAWPEAGRPDGWDALPWA